MTDGGSKKDPAGAKSLSKLAMFVGGLWVLAGGVLKGMGLIDLSVPEIIGIGAGAVAVWVPAYASIYIDKIKGGEQACMTQ